MKALGVGLGAFGFHDVWVERADVRAPSLVVTAAAADLAVGRRRHRPGTCRSPTATTSPRPTSSPSNVRRRDSRDDSMERAGRCQHAPMIEEYQQAWDELTAPGAQFAVKEITVRDVPIKVFESALPSMRFVWEMAAGVRRSRLHRLRGRALHVRRVRCDRPRARPSPARRPRRRVRRPRRDRDAQLSRVGVQLLGDRVARRGVRRHERVVDHRRDEVRPGRLEAEGRDRRQRARRADPAGARRAAGRSPAPPASPSATTATCRPTPSRWDDVVDPADGAGRPCRTRRSTPTTTPASSTPRARRASRRAPSSPTGARCTT